MTKDRFLNAAQDFADSLATFAENIPDKSAPICTSALEELTQLGFILAKVDSIYEAERAETIYYYGDFVDKWEQTAQQKTDRAFIDAVDGTPLCKRAQELEQKRLQNALKPVIENQNGEYPVANFSNASKRSLVTAFSDVEYTPPEFLINPYIPMGKITILQGDPSAGKTAVACSLAALVSTGGTLCGHTCKPRPVLLLSYEDDQPTLRGRLEANGANLERVFFCDKTKLEDLKKDGEETILTFTDPRIEEMIRDTNAGLVVFDPMQLFFGADVDMNKANVTRPVMEHLRTIAERNNCAVVIIAHLNKQGSKAKAMYRALGSMDIPASARSVIHIGRDPDNKDNRVMLHVKSSNAKDGESLAFEIGERGKVTWKGETQLTYEDIERAASRKQDNGIAYEDEPLVKVIRSLIAENAGGVFVTNAELYNYGMELLQYPPVSKPNKIGEKIRDLQYEARTKDHILLTTCSKRPKAFIRFGKPYGGSGGATQGVDIRQYTPQQEAFQQVLTDDEGQLPTT